MSWPPVQGLPAAVLGALLNSLNTAIDTTGGGTLGYKLIQFDNLQLADSASDVLKINGETYYSVRDDGLIEDGILDGSDFSSGRVFTVFLMYDTFEWGIWASGEQFQVSSEVPRSLGASATLEEILGGSGGSRGSVAFTSETVDGVKQFKMTVTNYASKSSRIYHCSMFRIYHDGSVTS